jgi:hypothetical protein
VSAFAYDVKLRIPRASETSSEELGDPTADRDYLVCAYHTVAGESSLFAAEPLFADRPCGGKACWRATASGFQATNRSGRTTRLRALGVKARPARRASAKASGALTTVVAPPAGTPLSLPVTIRVVAGDTCWSATSPSASENTGTSFKARDGS